MTKKDFNETQDEMNKEIQEKMQGRSVTLGVKTTYLEGHFTLEEIGKIKEEADVLLQVFQNIEEPDERP